MNLAVDKVTCEALALVAQIDRLRHQGRVMTTDIDKVTCEALALVAQIDRLKARVTALEREKAESFKADCVRFSEGVREREELTDRVLALEGELAAKAVGVKG